MKDTTKEQWEKEMSNLLPNSPSISWKDLRGLTWIVFEEEL